MTSRMIPAIEALSILSLLLEASEAMMLVNA